MSRRTNPRECLARIVNRTGLQWRRLAPLFTSRFTKKNGDLAPFRPLLPPKTQVGDSLERDFLHHLAGEKNSRTVRTAFFAAIPPHSPAAEAGGSPGTSPTDARRLDRYEWVEQHGEALPRSDARLASKIEQVLFGVREARTFDRLTKTTLAISPASPRQSPRVRIRSRRILCRHAHREQCGTPDVPSVGGSLCQKRNHTHTRNAGNFEPLVEQSQPAGPCR